MQRRPGHAAETAAGCCEPTARRHLSIHPACRLKMTTARLPPSAFLHRFIDNLGQRREDIRRGEDVVGRDSFKQIEILMSTQERFGTRFRSAEVDGFRTLDDLVAAILRRGS
jgi:acyl carrier protein